MKIQIMPSREDYFRNFLTIKVLKETLFMIGRTQPKQTAAWLIKYQPTNVQFIFDSQAFKRDVDFDFM